MSTPDDLIRSIYDAPLEPAEFERRLRAALADEDDMRQLVELIAWFRHAYPTARAPRLCPSPDDRVATAAVAARKAVALSSAQTLNNAHVPQLGTVRSLRHRWTTAIAAAIALAFIGAACSRSPAGPPDAKPVTTPAATTEGRADASKAESPQPRDAGRAPRPDCAEPATLVQLGTVRDVVAFEGNVLVGERRCYDPETLAVTPRMAKPAEPERPKKQGRYAEVAGGRGLIANTDDEAADVRLGGSAVVEDVATRKRLLAIDFCAAGGSWTYRLSRTGRFLICDSNRAGQTLWDLTARHPSPDDEVTWPPDGRGGDEGLALSPNDAYAVSVPVLSWGGGLPTRASITYFDLDKHTSMALARAPNPEASAPVVANPYDVAFCGDGLLFATSGEKELTVYRGRDGNRLAGALAMKGGNISFSASGQYLSQTRGAATTVFRLEP